MKYQVSVNEMILSLPDKTIYGKAFAPENTNGKLRAVILSHGYNSSCEALSDVAFSLAEAGVFAYCYDFCGGSLSSKSSGSPLDMSIQSEIQDLEDVIRHIENLDNVDSDNIFLYGESQGGFVSALAADERIRGLYLLYPAFCIPDDWNKIMSDGIPEKIDLMGMTLSKHYCEGLPRYDVFEHISRYNGSVKIYHGDSDTLVPVSYAQKAKDSFKNAELTVFSGEGHGFSGKARQKLIALVCENFIL